MRLDVIISWKIFHSPLVGSRENEGNRNGWFPRKMEETGKEVSGREENFGFLYNVVSFCGEPNGDCFC